MHFLHIEIGISSGALCPLSRLTAVIASLDWHGGKCWKLLILDYIKALVTAVLRGTAQFLPPAVELGMTVLVQMWGGEKGRHLKEAEGGQWQVVRPCVHMHLRFLQTLIKHAVGPPQW